jgi:hypothetical protein
MKAFWTEKSYKIYKPAARTAQPVATVIPTRNFVRQDEICANLCFGGARRNRLFMVASQSLYSVYVVTRGAHIA